MHRKQREMFDAMVEAEIEALPAPIRALLEEVPVIVEDEPDDATLAAFGLTRDDADELCGLHSGVAFTDQSVEASGELPSEIMLYRVGIVAEAGGWEEQAGDRADGESAEYDTAPRGGPEAIREQIRITLLHEIGHQFGLDEDDLDRLGYA
jgi:predicted Zn-dependent protease with MMP-like domain